MHAITPAQTAKFNFFMIFKPFFLVQLFFRNVCAGTAAGVHDDQPAFATTNNYDAKLSQAVELKAPHKQKKWAGIDVGRRFQPMISQIHDR
jgi:hypothetical protein